MDDEQKFERRRDNSTTHAALPLCPIHHCLPEVQHAPTQGNRYSHVVLKCHNQSDRRPESATGDPVPRARRAPASGAGTRLGRISYDGDPINQRAALTGCVESASHGTVTGTARPSDQRLMARVVMMGR
eukprot:759407-Hanusia_phi.AAC.2